MLFVVPHRGAGPLALEIMKAVYVVKHRILLSNRIL
jgi:hypothetical protein